MRPLRMLLRVRPEADRHGRVRLRDSAGVAALLGWVLPGLGHLWLGRPGKALHYFVVIGAAWGLGLRLTEGLGVSFERHPVWLAAEAWLAGPTLAAAWLARDLAPTHRIAAFDVGQLYLAVASLLNLVVVADAIGIADQRSVRRAGEEAARRRAIAAATAADERAAPAEAVPPAAALGHPQTAAQDEWPPPAALAAPAPSPADAPVDPPAPHPGAPS